MIEKYGQLIDIDTRRYNDLADAAVKKAVQKAVHQVGGQNYIQQLNSDTRTCITRQFHIILVKDGKSLKPRYLLKVMRMKKLGSPSQPSQSTRLDRCGSGAPASRTGGWSRPSIYKPSEAEIKQYRPKIPYLSWKNLLDFSI